MCDSIADGGRRCGALEHTRAAGRIVREAVKEAKAEAAKAAQCAAVGDVTGATQAARASYAAFKRADAAQKKAFEAAERGTTDESRLIAGKSAAHAKMNAGKAAKAAKSAQASAKSADSVRASQGAQRGVLGTDEPRDVPPELCEDCGDTLVFLADEDNKIVGTECLSCDGATEAPADAA